jgi:hypothetical protein
MMRAPSRSHHDTTMINAVLVFNNAGQPRLTKFYTQLVRIGMRNSATHAHTS